jgi:hypothetical protein
MRCDSRASFLASILASLCLGREPKARVAIKMWAKNAFDEWREFWGFDTKKFIIDLAKDEQTIWSWRTCCPCSFFKLQRKMVVYTHQQVMNP